MSAILTAWLLTVAMHGSVFLGLAWIVDRLLQSKAEVLRGGSWRESLWRAALFGGALTASLQLASGLPMLAGRWQLVPEVSSAAQVVMDDAAVRMPVAAAESAATPKRETSEKRARVAEPAEKVGSPPKLQTERSGQADGAPTGRVAASSPALSWTTWLVCAWLAGALIALTRVLLNLIALRGALVAAAPVVDEVANDDAAALAMQANSVSPRIFSLEALESPLATARARIVLPIWAISTLDRPQLRAMLAHEVAHLSRFDPEWKLVVAVWLSLFWFVPFGRIAQRRLDEIAELACDAFAARAVGNGRDLAECLAACAERHEQDPVFMFATAMAVRESSFIQRIEQLLEGNPMINIESRAKTSAVRAFVFGALVAGAICLPGIGLSPSPAYAAEDAKAPGKAAKDNSHISIHGDDGKETTTISFSDDDHRFRATIDGKIAFNAEETDVASLSAGGKASFEETVAGVTQRIEVSEKGGQIVRRYFVDGTERTWDSTAGVWLGKLILEVERSGVGAEAREQRLFAAGGAKGVLDEIDHIPNDYARSRYMKLLLARGRLGSADLDRAVQLAGASRSDYERRQQLQAIFQTQALGAPQQITFLHQAMRFDSDYERAELLVEIAPTLVDRADVHQAWLDAALGVRSDYERRRTLTAMLDRPALDDTQLSAVIKASSTMGSDYERRELLVAAIRRAHDTEKLAPAYASAVQGIGSAYERREALLALIRSGKVGVVGANAILDAAVGIDSSYERREVLVELARVMPRDTGSVERYRKVSGSLDEYDRREAERALVL